MGLEFMIHTPLKRWDAANIRFESPPIRESNRPNSRVEGIEVYVSRCSGL